MPEVVVNSTPLIILCRINQLNLLKELYHEIMIPEAVLREVTAKNDAVSLRLQSAGEWIHIESIKDQSEKAMYKARLHDGEVEVMILAGERDAKLLIIDDNAAKKTAKYLGFPVTGTLGVILRAKREGIIPEVRPLIAEIRRSGFYVSDAVEQAVLEQAGE